MKSGTVWIACGALAVLLSASIGFLTLGVVASFASLPGGGGSDQAGSVGAVSCDGLQDVPKGYSQYICPAAEKAKIDPAFGAAIIYYENRDFPGGAEPWKHAFPCSSQGACGVAQFIQSTFDAVGVDGENFNPGDGGGNGTKSRDDFSDAIFSSAKYLASLGAKPVMTEQQVKDAACKYNGGPGCSLSIPETADYVEGVAEAWKRFRGGGS